MIAFLIAALVGGIVFYALIVAKGPAKGRSKSVRRNSSSPHGNLRDVKAKWDVIMATAGTGPAGLKIAVSDGDKLFDAVLSSQGFPGDKMADRLKAARNNFSQYSVYDGIWRAHKLRNALAHEVGFDLVPSQAREALSDFERGLKDLKAL